MSLPPNPQAAQKYLQTKVLTATPEQLQMMLFDGALRFCEQARVAMQRQRYEESYSLIGKVQKIVLEMTTSLKHNVSPDLCKKLAALYTFAYKRLVTANLQHDPAALDEALQVLRYQRETWAMLMQQLAQQKAGAVARQLDIPAPSSRMEASLSMQG
jgi:flagellar secretion chaperone FliS